MTRAQVLVGDCLEVMAQMEACSVDAIVTDPPYELGFMGKSWDASGVAFRVEVWREALRVLKPGGHLLAFSGSRTYHRMAVAIEDAGFEIRDQIMWVYGSGFPKSHDVSKAIDREAGAEREILGFRPGVVKGIGGRYNWHTDDQSSGRTFAKDTAPATHEAQRWQGWGTALKPAHEPIVVARKPLIGTVAANVLAHGTGALNIDGCRVECQDKTRFPSGAVSQTESVFGGGNGRYADRPRGEDSNPFGRWPANLIHDGSEEVVGMFPDSRSAYPGRQDLADAYAGTEVSINNAVTDFGGKISGRSHSDSGTAARFFYSAKASKRDRDDGMRAEGRANIHPTVKPTDLMRYLCRLVTTPGGLVLDPFTGSGSTGKGAVLEGFRFMGIELSPEYADIARARIQHAVGYVEPQPVAQEAQDNVLAGQLRLFA